MSSIICYSSPKPYYDPLKTMKHHQNKIQSPNPLRHIYFLHVVAAELNPPPSAAIFQKNENEYFIKHNPLTPERK